MKVGLVQDLGDARPSARWSTPSDAARGCTFRRNPDDKVFADMIVLKRDDGELTTITMDEFTELAASRLGHLATPGPPRVYNGRAVSIGGRRVARSIAQRAASSRLVTSYERQPRHRAVAAHAITSGRFRQTASSIRCSAGARAASRWA